MNGFAPNLIQAPKIRSPDYFYPQNWYPTKSKMAAAAILKITYLPITRPLLHAFAPNLNRRWKWGPAERFTVKIAIVKNPRWRRPPFWNQLNGNNSANFERIRTKFDTETKNRFPGQRLPSQLVSDKIQDGGGRHIENHIFGYNSAITAHICTEFEREVILSKYT